MQIRDMYSNEVRQKPTQELLNFMPKHNGPLNSDRASITILNIYL